MKKLLALAALLTALTQANGQSTFYFDLQGTAGLGLLTGNEPAVTGSATGGEVAGLASFSTWGPRH